MTPGGLAVRVLGTGAFLPERVVTNAELAARFDCTPEWILQRTGIRERRYAAPGTATSDLAVAAARRALAAARVPPGELDLVLCATYTPDMSFPSTACLVQDRLGARGAGGVDLQAACSGFLYALVTGAQFVATGFARRVLVLGADVNSTIADPADRNVCILFGDGAGAVVLGPAEETGSALLGATLGADGGGGNHFTRPAGGSKLPPTPATVEDRRHFIRMNGSELFKFGVKALAETAEATLRGADRRAEEVACFIPHQANARIVTAGVERLAIPRDRIYLNLDRYGNTAAASVPIALDEAVRAGRFARGDLVLLVGFGAGLTWGGALLRW